MIDPDPLFLLYWLLRGPSCGRDCGVVPGRRRATRICQYARNILQAGSGKPAGNAVSWHLLMHLADMKALSVGAGPRFDSGTTPRLRYPTRWPFIRRQRAKYWYCTDSQKAQRRQRTNLWRNTDSGEAYRRQIARLWHTTDATRPTTIGNATNIGPPPTLASLSVGAGPFYESVTTPMVSERQHRDAVWISTDAA